MRLIFRCNNFIGRAPFCPFTTNLSHPIHGLIDHAVKVVLVLFLAIRLDWWGNISGNWVDLLNSLFQIVYYHGFLDTFLLDSLEFQGWNGLTDDSGFSVDSDEFLVLDFVEVISLGQVNILWNKSVASLKLLSKLLDFIPLVEKGFCSHAKGTNVALLEGFLFHVAWLLMYELRCSSTDHRVYQYGNGRYARPSAQIVSFTFDWKSTDVEDYLWILRCLVPHYIAIDDYYLLFHCIEDRHDSLTTEDSWFWSKFKYWDKIYWW